MHQRTEHMAWMNRITRKAMQESSGSRAEFIASQIQAAAESLMRKKIIRCYTQSPQKIGLDTEG